MDRILTLMATILVNLLKRNHRLISLQVIKMKELEIKTEKAVI